MGQAGLGSHIRPCIVASIYQEQGLTRRRHLEPADPPPLLNAASSIPRMSLPPWDQETFSFGWNFESGAIPQCSILKLSFDNDLGDPSLHANPAPAPPYTVSVYQGGYAPLTLAVGNIGQAGTYPWTVNLPVNNPFMLTMKDSAGYTGGTSTRFTVMPGSSNCSLSANPMPPPSLSFTRTGNSQCGNVNIVVNNGTSPYQVEIIPEVRQQKTLHFATNKFDFVLDIPMSLSYIIAITDAEGHSAIDGILAVGSSSDGSCLNAATTMTIGKFTSMITGSGVSMPSATGTATGAGATQTGSNNPPKSGPKRWIFEVIGAVVGVIAIAALIFLVCWFRRRRRSKRREAARRHQSEVEGSKPEISHANSGYSLPYGPQSTYGLQSTYSGAPQIQEHDSRANASTIGERYTPSSVYPSNQSYAPYTDTPPVQYSGITTHAPQARPLGQSISYYSAPSAGQQSPFSQSGAGGDPSLTGGRSTAGGTSSPAWSADRKEPVASLSSESPSGGQVPPWGMAMSPPPRSLTGTALPPYPLDAQYQGPNRG